MLKNKTICDPTGRNVTFRVFSKGRIYYVTQGDQTIFETNSEQSAKSFYEIAVKLIPKSKRSPKKKKKLIIFSGGLPTLGKR